MPVGEVRTDAFSPSSGFKFSRVPARNEWVPKRAPIKPVHLTFVFAHPEIILSLLLSNYSFVPTGKPVLWNLSAVVYPTMGSESEKPEVLLKIKALQA